MKILVLCGHPDGDSFNGSLARAYADGAREASHEVVELELGKLYFDPSLHHGYKVIQELEPDLQKAQELIRWCDHLVVVFPSWWGSMPAILKGFLDRIFLPGFAFKYRPNSVLWDRLLRGRSARVIITMDSPTWYYRYFVGAPGWKSIGKGTLSFSGFRPIRSTFIGKVRLLTEDALLKHIEGMKKLGRRAA